MEIVAKTLLYIGNLILFIFLTIIFIPSFLVVNYLQETWSKMLESLF